jgi:hypothetical protein
MLRCPPFTFWYGHCIRLVPVTSYHETEDDGAGSDGTNFPLRRQKGVVNPPKDEPIRRIKYRDYASPRPRRILILGTRHAQLDCPGGRRLLQQAAARARRPHPQILSGRRG